MFSLKYQIRTNQLCGIAGIYQVPGMYVHMYSNLIKRVLRVHRNVQVIPANDGGIHYTPLQRCFFYINNNMTLHILLL